jgi:hypothetical protein
VLELGLGRGAVLASGPREAGAGDGRDHPGAVDAPDAVVVGVGEEQVTRGGMTHDVRRGVPLLPDGQVEHRLERRPTVATEALLAAAGDRGDRPLGVYHPDPLVGLVGHQQIPLGVVEHARGQVENGVQRRAAITGVAASPRAGDVLESASRGIDPLDPAVVPRGDHHPPLAVEGDVRRVVEPVAHHVAREAGRQLALAGDDLQAPAGLLRPDAVIVPVDHHQPPLGGEGDVGGRVQHRRQRRQVVRAVARDPRAGHGADHPARGSAGRRALLAAAGAQRRREGAHQQPAAPVAPRTHRDGAHGRTTLRTRLLNVSAI